MQEVATMETSDRDKKYGSSAFGSDDNPIRLVPQYVQPPFGTSLLPHSQWTGFCVQPRLNGQVCQLTLPSNISSTTVQPRLNANSNSILVGHRLVSGMEAIPLRETEPCSACVFADLCGACARAGLLREGRVSSDWQASRHAKCRKNRKCTRLWPTGNRGECPS